MKITELFKSDTMAAIKRADKTDKKLAEAPEFKDYVASDDEIKEELASAKKSLALYRQQGNAPMAAKMETKIKQAEDRLNKSKD